MTCRSILLLAALVLAGCGEAEPPAEVDETEVEEVLSYAIGGEVTGLLGSGLVLLLNDEFELSVSDEGSFLFEGISLEAGSPYEVVVLVQPRQPAQLCELEGAAGTVGDTDVSIALACRPRQYRVGGTLTGLQGEGLTLSLNDTWTLEPTEDGDITFHEAFLDDGVGYEVMLSEQPMNPSQTCSLAGESGLMDGADITDVRVVCQTNRYLVGGTVEGLVGQGLVLELNGLTTLAVEADGAFVFEEASVEDGRLFEVVVKEQPVEPEQVCEFAVSGGMIVGEDVTTLALTCVDVVTVTEPESETEPDLE